MGVCLGIDPITESLSRLARELAQSESPESDPPQEAVTGKDSVEIELARLDAALAAHDVEMSEFWGSFQPERPSIGHSSDSQEQVPAVTEDRRKRCTTEAASFSSSWQERAFPGLAERRWLQLLVDESVSIYADPVTLRQFLPVYDKAQRVTGEFVEIDADHPNYIEAQDLQEAIQGEHWPLLGSCCTFFAQHGAVQSCAMYVLTGPNSDAFYFVLPIRAQSRNQADHNG